MNDNRGYSYWNPISEIIWFLLGVLEIILALRFVLKLVGANAGSPFVSFMYSLSGHFVSPFQYALSTQYVQGATVEWVTILAMVVYWIIAYIIVYLIDLIF